LVLPARLLTALQALTSLDRTGISHYDYFDWSGAVRIDPIPDTLTDI
jgi:hypothetical protein